MQLQQLKKGEPEDFNGYSGDLVVGGVTQERRKASYNDWVAQVEEHELLRTSQHRKKKYAVLQCYEATQKEERELYEMSSRQWNQSTGCNQQWAIAASQERL